MNTVFGFQQYSGARVGAESADSIVTSTDARATALDAGIGSWITGLGTKARVADTAFAASWKQWFADWLAFRNTYSVLPALAKETDSARKEAEDRQKALYVWEARFQAQKEGKDTMTTPSGSVGGFPSWLLWVPVVGAAAYGVWRFVLKGRL